MSMTLYTNNPLANIDQQVITKHNYFFVRSNNQLKKVNVEEIRWVHADGNYCYINTEVKKFAVKISMRKLMQRFTPRQFVRIHKSYMVNIDSIDRIDINDACVLIGDQSLPIGRVFKEELFERLDIL